MGKEILKALINSVKTDVRAYSLLEYYKNYYIIIMYK